MEIQSSSGFLLIFNDHLKQLKKWLLGIYWNRILVIHLDFDLI